MTATVAHWVARWGLLCVAAAATATIAVAQAWARHAQHRRRTLPPLPESEPPTEVGND